MAVHVFGIRHHGPGCARSLAQALVELAPDVVLVEGPPEADGIVADVAFTGRGCAISQASASLLTDEVKGKSVDEVAKLTSQDLLDLIGIEISPARLKCALLSLDTLEHALADADGLAGAVGAHTPANGAP